MPVDYEHHEQAALFDALETHARQYPELRLAFAIPNGGKRTKAVAGKLKAEGAKRGVPDIFLPVPRGRYHGLFIELKAIYPDGSRGRPSREQIAYVDALNERGYQADIIAGWENALEAILEYIRLE